MAEADPLVSAERDCSAFLPDELVAEILLRLPSELLFRCKLVSKQWKSIISHPKFAQNYMHQQARNGSELFQMWEFAFPLDPYLLTPGTGFDVDDDDDVSVPMPSFTCVDCVGNRWRKDKKMGRILASSNGLVLSSRSFRVAIRQPYLLMKLKLRVSNPVTKQSVQLPCLKGPFSDCVFGFTTRRGGGENAPLVTYKVVLIQRISGSPVVAGFVDSTIHIFSSDTWNWTTVGEQPNRCPEAVFHLDNSPKAITRNSVLHWFDRITRTMVTYDPYGTPDRFGLIPFPNGSSKQCLDVVVSDHEDVLKFGEIDLKTYIETDMLVKRRLRVWRLVDCNKGEWRLEKVCVVTQGRNLQFSKLFAQGPHEVLPHQFHAYLFEVPSDPPMVMSLPVLKTIPVVSCPWSSPF